MSGFAEDGLLDSDYKTCLGFVWLEILRWGKSTQCDTLLFTLTVPSIVLYSSRVDARETGDCICSRTCMDPWKFGHHDFLSKLFYKLIKSMIPPQRSIADGWLHEMTTDIPVVFWKPPALLVKCSKSTISLKHPIPEKTNIFSSNLGNSLPAL